MASVLLEGLHALFPGAEIDWLLAPSLTPLMEGHPLINSVIAWDKEEWRRAARKADVLGLWREVRSLGKRLSSRRYDLALDCQGLLRSRFLCWISGASRKIGFESREPGGFLMDRLISRPDSSLFASEYLHMLRELGYTGDDPLPSLHLKTAVQEAARRLLESQATAEGHAVIAPFTTRPQKHWSHTGWAEVMTHLHKKQGLMPVVLGGPEDEERGRAIVAAAGCGLSLAGACSVAESAAVVSQARLVVGVDTGITHMGTAFHRPTVALFGATRPYLEPPSPATAIIYHGLPCSPCRRRPVCDNKHTCMETITVREVIEACEAAIASTQEAGGAKCIEAVGAGATVYSRNQEGRR